MNKLSLQLKCICLRNGVELWIESERLGKINLEKAGRFLKIGEEIINTADIVGIFTAQAMGEKTRRQNGEWQCKFGYWHERRQECMHNEDSNKPKIIRWNEVCLENRRIAMKPVYEK